jgi:hypothetical protein
VLKPHAAACVRSGWILLARFHQREPAEGS